MVDASQYERCGESLEMIPGVVGADVVDRDELDRPLLEVVVGTNYVRVPPRILRRIVEYDLGVRSIQLQGVNGEFVVEVI